MGVQLKEELEASGWDQSPDEFRVLIADTFHDMFKSWTPEEMLYHPKECGHFCNMVRKRSGLSDLPDYVILRTPRNIQKATRVGSTKLRLNPK